MGLARRGEVRQGLDRQGRGPTMTKPFEPAREDGRSDKRVVYDLVKDADPGRVFAYDELAAALQEGIGGDIPHERIGRAARAASRQFLNDDQRALQVVPMIGYRIAKADDHAVMAQQHHRKAKRESQQSISLITNVRDSELSPEFRGLIRDLRVAFGAVAQMIHAAERRTQRVENVLDEVVRVNQDLSARVARLEGQEATP